MQNICKCVKSQSYELQEKVKNWFESHIMCVLPGECSDSVCDLVSCANGGVCFANRADGYICLCPLGFRGALCEESESTLFFFFSQPHLPTLKEQEEYHCESTEQNPFVVSSYSMAVIDLLR